MRSLNYYLTKPSALLMATLLWAFASKAQTDADAIMMKKNLLCVGPVYTHSSWQDYWEGTFKRDNANLGTVSTQMYAVMGNYGITDNVNLLFSLPYVQTHATAGTLRGQRGLQDLSLMLKWKALRLASGKNTLSVYAIGGVSSPVSNYVRDYLPLSIGMGSTNIAVRGMVDFQRGKFFTTLSGMFAHRSNITIDRTSYYTMEMHNTNIVDMPNIAGANLRAGYRTRTWVAEALVDNMTTLGGFDIRRNDMPFPSNRMNATQAGINLKYTVPSLRNLELLGGARYTVAGRNVGQATTIYGGVFYIFNFSKKSIVQTNQNNKP